jgi:hypothetical protein
MAEPARYRNMETQSGTRMPWYRTEILNADAKLCLLSSKNYVKNLEKVIRTKMSRIRNTASNMMFGIGIACFSKKQAIF